MARVTVEDCLQNETNRFALIVLASERARQLMQGKKSLVYCHNKVAVTALREIAAGRVKFNENVKDVIVTWIAEKKALAAEPRVAGGARQNRGSRHKG
ncbi:MAG: DNA-directed polymerase subunit omega [Myxococcales bacterium]|jgi:DNA-directed RNA polymerase subunit omega|nr:DNA-directed polymerase subunit omega [Myxococcales bacterium]